MPTTVHNIRDLERDYPDWRSDPDYVYIGRENGSYKLLQSKWAAPRWSRHESREEAIDNCLLYITGRNRPLAHRPELWSESKTLLADLHELKGKKLVCWCHPEACHGDILAELADKLP